MPDVNHALQSRKLLTNIGIDNEDQVLIVATFIEVLADHGFTSQRHDDTLDIAYKDYAVCSLHFHRVDAGISVSLEQTQHSTNKLIQDEKVYFDKYSEDNTLTKDYMLLSDNQRDELIHALVTIRRVFFDDITVDFRIQSVKLKNYRCFKDEAFTLNEQSTVLLGKNASGKTSLLEAITVAMSTFVNAINEPTDSKTIREEDVRFTVREEEGVLTVNHHTPTTLYFETTLINDQIEWSRGRNSLSSTRLTTKESNVVTDVVRQLVEDIRNEKQERKIVLPVFSYHGTGRLATFTRDMGAVEKMERISRFYGYKDCLKPASNYKAFIAWYRKMKFRAFEMQVQIPSLDAVTDSITQCLRLLTEEEDRRVEDTRYAEGLIHVKYADGELLPISHLSDGYRDVIGIISDIASRMAILNPHLGENVLQETPGIVLIDEVELHLHPRWQQKILYVLKTLFPKVQFITTTHAPLIIASTEKNEAFEIQHADGRFVAKPVGNPRDWYIADIVANTFHVPEKPLYVLKQNVEGLPLAERMENFSNAVKEYVAKPCEQLKDMIEMLYQELLPSLPEDTPRRRAVDSLRGLVK